MPIPTFRLALCSGGRCVIFVCLALLVGPAGLLAQGGPPATVAVRRVVRQVFAESVDLLGEASAFREGRASAEVDGLVVALLAEEGQSVKPPQVLLRIKDTLLKIRERRAHAQLDLARQQLAEYLKGARPEELREARARLEEARAQEKEAVTDLRRMEKLVAGGAATNKELIAAQTTARRAGAVVATRKAVLDRIAAGPRVEQIARARAQVEIRQAELDEIRDELERTRVRAPFKGVVTRKLVDLGHFVHRGDAVLELVQLDPIRVIVPVPEAQVNRLAPGLKLSIRFDALPGRPLVGRVESIVPMGDERARTFPVRVVLPNLRHAILPGMVARVRVPLSPPRQSLAVPRDAILERSRGPMIWLVRQGTAVAVPVTVGVIKGPDVEVKGALKEDEQVVVRGNESLRPGQRVVVVPGRDKSGRGRKHP